MIPIRPINAPPTAKPVKIDEINDVNEAFGKNDERLVITRGRGNFGFGKMQNHINTFTSSTTLSVIESASPKNEINLPTLSNDNISIFSINPTEIFKSFPAKITRNMSHTLPPSIIIASHLNEMKKKETEAIYEKIELQYTTDLPKESERFDHEFASKFDSKKRLIYFV